MAPKTRQTSAVDLEAAPIDFASASARSLLAHGHDALHQHVATRLAAALGSELPQMEVRVRHLHVSADAVVLRKAESEHAYHLPTLPNTLRLALSGLNAKRQVVRREILRDFSGVFRPGEMTLVLGHPGSGKSTLLQYLSGRFRGEKESHVTISGSATYNGVDRHELRHNLPQFVSYVTQRDEHYPVLTVKEVLEYAHAFSGGVSLEKFLSVEAESQAKNSGQRTESRVQREESAEEAFRALNQHIPDVIVHQLGLQNCQDTIVGDALLRGVSGGERKRVTTGEMEFGLRFVKTMDEISTGLDAAATFDIIRGQRSLARKLKRTIIVALLQPPPEVYELFDNVILLKDGEVMYQGPREQVTTHFESLGLVRRPERDEADFLLDIATSKQSQHQVPEATNIPTEPSQFAAALRSSTMYQTILREVDEQVEETEEMAQERQRLLSTPQFNLTFWEEVNILVRRELLLLWRNQPFVRGRLLMALFVGLFYGSVFYQVDAREVQVKLGVLFSSIQFLGFNQGTNIPQFLSGRPIFYKQRDAHFYRTSSYVLAASVAQVPLILAECFLFGTIMYFMCGLHAAVYNYVIYMILLILTSLAFASWFFFLAVSSPDMHVAEPFQLLSIVVFIMFAGFMVTRDTLPSYLVWLYWLDPVAWCIRALGVLEYRSGPFSRCLYDGIDYCTTYGKGSMGEYYLELYGVPSASGWVYYGIIFMVVCYIVCIGLGYRALEHKRFDEHDHQPGVAPDASSSETVDASGAEEDTSEAKYRALKSPRASNEAIITIPRHEKNFVPVTLAFKDLWYSVADPKDSKGSTQLDLLKGVSGYACPGKMTALMGASGAGKTTLMDVIAGRKTGGVIRGEILLNGHPASDIAVRRATGYCEQMDIHSDAATFREALTFSAFLRQDASISKAAKLDSVEESLDLLDLRPLANRIIRGSTVEQMKRLTIGVELAAQPSVLFLDEPTSGLDARAAKVIMEGVRKVADTGRTVVCTIHQPSYEVFSLFDMLLLLKRGGQLVYFGELGENSRSLVQYFEAIEGVSPLPDNYNPATWMLECIGAGVDASSSADTVQARELGQVTEEPSNGGSTTTADFAALFEQSDLHSQLHAMLANEGVGRPAPDIPTLAFESKRAASSVTQMKFVVQRFVDQYWRTPAYNLSRFIISIILALLFGIMFVGSKFETYTQVSSGLGMIFVATLFNSLIAMNAVMPTACDDRAPFYRERASQTYNAFWYFVGATLVEIPYCFASALVFTVIMYPMVGFTGFVSGVQFWLALALSVLMATYIGQLWVYLCPSLDVAAVGSVAINTIWFLLMGFNPPAGSIPHGYKWLYTLTPFRYPLSIMSSLPFGKCVEASDVGCQLLQNAPPTVGNATIEEFLAAQFNMEYDNVSRDFGVTLAFIVVFRLLSALALRFINHQKR